MPAVIFRRILERIAGETSGGIAYGIIESHIKSLEDFL